MASEVSICNQALSWLGANLIISLDDETTEAKLCKANYVDIRNSVLEAYDWTFAVKWFELPKAAETPVGEYPNAYPLPPEVLRVVFVGQDYDHQEKRWQVEAGNILTDAAACKTKCIIEITDPNKFSALFIQALSARLAADLAIPLTNSRSLMETHYQVYQRKLLEAYNKDSSQGRSRRINSRWLLQARAQGPRAAGPTV